MKSIFSDYNLSGLQLSNRVVMAPMTRARAVDNCPIRQTALYYKQRAGAGLIVTEGSPISRQGYGLSIPPGIHTDAQVEAGEKLQA